MSTAKWQNIAGSKNFFTLPPTNYWRHLWMVPKTEESKKIILWAALKNFKCVSFAPMQRLKGLYYKQGWDLCISCPFFQIPILKENLSFSRGKISCKYFGGERLTSGSFMGPKCSKKCKKFSSRFGFYKTMAWYNFLSNFLCMFLNPNIFFQFEWEK